MFVQLVTKNPQSSQYPFKYKDGLLIKPLVCMFQKDSKHESFCPGEQVSILINHGDDIAVLDWLKKSSIPFIGAAGGRCHNLNLQWEKQSFDSSFSGFRKYQ